MPRIKPDRTNATQTVTVWHSLAIRPFTVHLCQIMTFAPASSLKAILGPTNTGKTYYAIDRMLAHRSGMIGLPLRLLAREVYARIVEVVGPQTVALVTGEERIVPPSPRYWVATVEAMPTDIPVECLAIDEVQVATDFDRGHVFTTGCFTRGG